MSWREQLETALAAEERIPQSKPGGGALHAMAEELANRQDWDGLVAAAEELLRRASREADRSRRGRLRFGASVCAPRLAVLAPPAWAAQAVRFTRARTEIIELLAQAHTWPELEPFLDERELRLDFAYARVLKGEDLSTARGLVPDPAKPSLRLEPWEPDYAWRNYSPSGASAGPMVGAADVRRESLPEAPLAEAPDDEVCSALRAIVEADWHEVAAARVAADARVAVAALGYREAGFERCSLAHALRDIALAGADSGGHGADPGIVRGREKAWRVLQALAGDPRASADQLGQRGAELRWWRVDPERERYEWIWELYLAVEDPEAGAAWAVRGVDTD